jgi:hypothetical protein
MPLANLTFSLAASVLMVTSFYGQDTRVKTGHPADPAPQSGPAWIRSDGTIAVPSTGDGRQQSAKPAGATSAVPIIMFTQWIDPQENAFAMNVPQGWQVTGGLTRRSPIDANPTVRTQSPDDRIQIIVGDPNLLPASVPNQMTMYGGFREGQITQNAVGGPVLISRYQTGEQFARNYIYQKLCRQARITQSAVVPDATRELTEKAMAYGRTQGGVAQGWVGEASFQCGSQVGYVRAATILAGSPMVQQVWGVMELSGFVAAGPEDAVLARYVLNNMVGSLQLNPQWETRQAQLTDDVTGAVTRAQQQMAASIAQHARVEASHNQIDVMSGWEARNKVHDGAMARGDEARRGVTTVGDSTGTSYTVSNEYNYQWKRPDGSLMGTITDTPPDYSSGWELLKKQ